MFESKPRSVAAGHDAAVQAINARLAGLEVLAARVADAVAHAQSVAAPHGLTAARAASWDARFAEAGAAVDELASAAAAQLAAARRLAADLAADLAAEERADAARLAELEQARRVEEEVAAGVRRAEAERLAEVEAAVRARVAAGSL